MNVKLSTLLVTACLFLSSLSGWSQGLKISTVKDAMILLSHGEECDTLLQEKKIQLAASESNELDCKNRLDSSILSGKIKDRVIVTKAADNAKLSGKIKGLRGFCAGLLVYAIIREGFGYLKLH